MWIGDVGAVSLAIDLEAVDAGPECTANLTHGACELNPKPAGRGTGDGQSLRLKPDLHLRNVRRGSAETFAKLSRGEPFVVRRAALDMGILKILLQFCLAFAR